MPVEAGAHVILRDDRRPHANPRKVRAGRTSQRRTWSSAHGGAALPSAARGGNPADNRPGLRKNTGENVSTQRVSVKSARQERPTGVPIPASLLLLQLAHTGLSAAPARRLSMRPSPYTYHTPVTSRKEPRAVCSSHTDLLRLCSGGAGEDDRRHGREDLVGLGLG